MERRSSGLLRVPFVQKCHLSFRDGTSRSAFIVNINVLGAYIADDEPPHAGDTLSCRFRIPGNEIEVSVEGAVAWVNARQNHPVHSLPRGFGVKFVGVSPDNVRRIETVIKDWVARNPSR